MTPNTPINFQSPTALVLGNGNYPNWFDIKQFQVEYKVLLVCADGGAEKARQLNLMPDLIIGDMDSVTTDTINHFQASEVKIIHQPNQNNNDLEKCLRWLLRHGWRQFVLVGFTGRRDDQTIATLQIMRKYARRAQFLLYTETAQIYLLKKGIWLINAIPGQTISLFGFPRVYHLTTRGLQYPTKDENLTGGSHGLSNTAIDEMVQIQFSSGYLLVVAIQELN